MGSLSFNHRGSNRNTQNIRLPTEIDNREALMNSILNNNASLFLNSNNNHIMEI